MCFTLVYPEKDVILKNQTKVIINIGFKMITTKVKVLITYWKTIFAIAPNYVFCKKKSPAFFASFCA